MSEPRNTRERIQQVAMELFSTEGYDRTSLREIAERLGVTKAALYYHFKTKEDIAASYFEDFSKAIEEIQQWAAEQPRELQTRREVLQRYSKALNEHGPTLRFMHHNQPALRHLSKGPGFKDRMRELNQLLVPHDAPHIKKLRAANAIFAMHTAWFVDMDDQSDPADLQGPALQIALELIEANEA